MTQDISRRDVLKLSVGVAFGSGLLSACGSSDSGGSGRDEKGPIRIGALTDLTGAYGIVGKSNQATARFTVDEINAAGGVLGRKLELVVVDSASDPAAGAKVAGQLVNRDKVDMVIGGITSATREAVRGVIAGRGKTLYVWPGSYEGGECTDNVWSVGSVPNQQVEPTVQYLADQGAKTYFLCGNDYSYPRNILKAARAKIEATGGRVVGEQYIPIAATDAPELVTKVLAAKADAVFNVVILPASIPFQKGIIDGGYEGIVAGTLYDETIIPLVGKQAQGVVCVQDYYESIPDSFSKQKVGEFRAKYPKVAFGSAFNSPAWYRGIHLWAEAVKQAGSTELDAVNAKMDGVGVDRLIGGPAKFVPGTRHCALTTYLGEMQGDGKVKLLKELGSQPPKGQCA